MAARVSGGRRSAGGSTGAGTRRADGASAALALLDRPEQVRLALSPLRRRLLSELRSPGSASGLAAGLGLGRQRVNYHLRALEKAGLVELVEERQRRGCVERVLIATARAFVVDPSVLGAGTPPSARQDRFAAESLVAVGAGVVRDVARMRDRAAAQGRRLLTFALETEVRLEAPEDLDRFSAALARRVAETVAEFDTAGARRRYRVVAGGYPAPRSPSRRRRATRNGKEDGT